MQTLRTFLFSCSQFTALQKSGRFSLCFNQTSHLHMQCKALCTVVLVDKRQLLNSEKALDETATTISISNQRHNHVLLEICSCKMNRNTHSALKSIFMQRSNSCHIYSSVLKCKCKPIQRQGIIYCTSLEQALSKKVEKLFLCNCCNFG